ncbi:MAG: glycoside hydrolase family 31 protein [Chitinophagaceae bacterium]
MDKFVKIFLIKKRVGLLYFQLLIFQICLPNLALSQQWLYQLDGNSVTLNLNKGKPNQEFIRLQVLNPHTFHILISPEDNVIQVPSLMVLPQPQTHPFWSHHQLGNDLLIRTPYLTARISLLNGKISFTGGSGQPYLEEQPLDLKSFQPENIEGVASYQIRADFLDQDHRDALYGLGENQYGFANIKGQDILLAQHNSEAFVPFFISSAGYAVLWDNNSITRFGDPQSFQNLSTLKLFSRKDQPGGLTAAYFSIARKGHEPILRKEYRIDYSTISSLKNEPPGFKMSDSSLVQWKGFLVSPFSGIHRFLLTSGGYIKLWINGHLMVNRWRQSWNPVSTQFEYPLKEGQKYALRVDWKPDGGQSFLTLKWKKPVPASCKNHITLTSDMGNQINYYFMDGRNMDSVISDYRQLTGKAPLMPIWAYGFWQSREHYSSQYQILKIAREFRERHIPMDNLVQDWFYWKKDQWGSQEFDSSRYPHPKEMIDSLHQIYHTHFMISVWPKFYVNTPIFSTFWKKGWLYKKNVEDHQKDWVGYVSTFYDAFNPLARKAFWNLVNKKLYRLGIDAWWLDASEPDILSNTSLEEKKQLMDPNFLGPAAENFNAYPLENEKAFFQGQTLVDPDKRVFILTRSAFGGSQRFAAATWSGDTGTTWADMKNQITAGINFSFSGIPYWTMDIGGFATETKYQHPNQKNRKEWRELMTRWYQFGSFCPLFRVHGQFPDREIFHVAPSNHPAYQSMLFYDRLRYRLLPYIYSVAAMTYWNNYTIMRGLAMDFPRDSVACNLSDEFLFGPSLLINPVCHDQVTSRPVYLPKSKGWYNLYSGKFHPGGDYILAKAPYSRIPVFVKAGSIIPFGPAMEYAQQKPNDPLTLFVYTGANGELNLYEDDGLHNDYQQGAFSIIPIHYNQSIRRLFIGKRKGSYKGMLVKRTIRICWITPDHPRSLHFSTPADQVIAYNGQALSLNVF